MPLSAAKHNGKKKEQKLAGNIVMARQSKSTGLFPVVALGNK